MLSNSAEHNEHKQADLYAQSCNHIKELYKNHRQKNVTYCNVARKIMS